MSSSSKQLLMLLLAGVLLFYRPKSMLGSLFGVVLGIGLIVVSVSSIREHRKNINDKEKLP